MTHWKVILAYDGTPFHGWQIQPNLPTVQGSLADALHHVTDERVLPQGSGRTDTGVHALGQVASFSLASPIPPANLQRALNHCLPASIRVLTVELVPASFHARHSALRKTYEYRIFPLRASELRTTSIARDEAICPPTLAPFVWPCPWALELDALNAAAAYVVGTHDFTSFMAADPDQTSRGAEEAPPPPLRTITHSHWHSERGLLIYRVTASGFLHHMVRNLVGTFVMVGSRRLAADAIPTILAARDRSAGGPTAPPQGLFLHNVEYPALELPTAGGDQ